MTENWNGDNGLEVILSQEDKTTMAATCVANGRQTNTTSDIVMVSQKMPKEDLEDLGSPGMTW